MTIDAAARSAENEGQDSSEDRGVRLGRILALFLPRPPLPKEECVPVVCLHSRDEIEPFLRRNVYLHIYALGDLDPFFWPQTTWYALQDGGSIQAILLLYSAPQTPTLLALGDPPYDALCELLESARRLLPRRMYAHLSPGCSAILARDYRVESHGPHHKMALREPERLNGVDACGVAPLSPADEPELRALYAASYPQAWFDPRMLDAGWVYGVRVGDQLACAGSLHIYSPLMRVAAPGGIATHPRHRGHGYATKLTAALCSALRDRVDYIGLNVKADNIPALTCYEKLGFRRVAGYEECTVTL
jgi:GNAT superfamily N-acetyltransferase